jgi:dipeptide/tripeptide permease
MHVDARMASRFATLASAAVISAPVLLVLGTVLKATTHHRALGGTTFAVLALAIGAGCLAVGHRAGTLAGRWATSAERVRAVSGASAVLIAVVLGGLAAVRITTPLPRGPASGEGADPSP